MIDEELHILHDKRISLKAKGLAMLALVSPIQLVTKSWILEHCSDGRESVDSSLRELSVYGYATRIDKGQDPTGKFQGTVWVFRDHTYC